MEAYNKVQINSMNSIVRNRTNFKKSPKERITKVYVTVRLENLEVKWTSFVETHKKIISDIDETEYDASQYSTAGVYEMTEDLYLDYKTELNEILEKLNKSDTSEKNICSSEKPKPTCNIKLPKISLPMFSGQYADWVSFRDLFLSLIHNNQSLDDVQRLQYLKSHLTGEAEQLLKNVPISNVNYKTCWEQLNNRYNNKRFMANSILKRFLSQKNIVVESASALRELLDSSSDCLNALKNLDINVDSWDIIVIHILSLKLDADSRKLWEAKICEFSEELPTWEQFKKFLEQRFRSLEFLDNKSSKIHVNKNVPVKTLHVATKLCVYCESDHKLGHCKKFSNESVTSRRNFVQSNGLCFNCLGSGHAVYACHLPTRCRICKRKHHSLLHSKDASTVSADSKQDIKQSVDTKENQTSTVTNCAAAGSSQDLLPTALVTVKTGTGTGVVLRVLLDQCSQASYVTESAVQLLGLKKHTCYNTALRLGEDEEGNNALTSKYVVYPKLQSMHDPNSIVTVKAHVQKRITSVLPTQTIGFQLWPQVQNKKLADPTWNKPGRIDMLLSSSVYSKIIKQGLSKGPPGSLIAQDTTLGWILSGEVPENKGIASNNSHCYLTLQDDQNYLDRFWEIEEAVVSKKHYTEEEEECEAFFRKTTVRDSSGRYIVKLPFKTPKQNCVRGRTKDIALRRFLSLEKRLAQNLDLKKKYSDVMNEYLELGHMEPIPPEEVNREDVVYLPHHAVLREDKTTTKVRVVFDASCLGRNGVSLNSELMTGPTLQADLRHTVLRWRIYPICMVSDIVKMYRQVLVSSEDVDFQRLLWRSDSSEEIKHFRLLRVTFGTAAAPYLAVKTLHQLAEDEGDMYPVAKSIVTQNFYMDDLMAGCQTVSEGREIYKQMTELLAKGGFELQKWRSNNEELLKYINIDKHQEESHELKIDNVIKILGLTWRRESDEFAYTVNLPASKTPATKRNIISQISMLFDPLGWLAPVIIKAKILIQKLWLSGIDWDEELPCTLLNEWHTYRDELENLAPFRVPRWLRTSLGDSVELHGFSDASSLAYGAVIYIRVVDSQGGVHSRLVTAKTKVAPIKQISISRLELCASVLLVKLLREVAEVLNIERHLIFAWTDSSIVLAWLSKHPCNWQTFVANRVSEILSVVSSGQWGHVKSAENPADYASRGMNPTELISSTLWKEGPLWLKDKVIGHEKRKEYKTDLELKAKVISLASVSTEELAVWSKFSSLSKLIRVIAYCKRFLNFKRTPVKFTTWLSAKELNDALLVCVKHCQKQHFAAEIDTLLKIKAVARKSVLTSLNQFIDHDGILRVGGRLDRAALEEGMKHPIILPSKSHFTEIVIADAHKRTLHGGPQVMINFLRSRYWILDVKNKAKFFIRKCISCIRHAAKVREQLMGQLPKSRVNPSRAFRQSGVDYAGPINLRSARGRGHHAYKGYICLFVCMAIRAIHLEVVSDLSAKGFLAAFKRFVARRGHCADLYSDNGTNFVGAAKELKELVAIERSSVANEIGDWLADNGTNWHFIPPHAPHFGGLWEAGVKSTKYHLKRVIGNNTLTYEEMATVLAQIEACLNSRPMSRVSDNCQDQAPLTPGHFLVGEPLVVVPDLNYEQSNITSLKRLQLTQRMVQDFWRRWSHEYLAQFLNRYKWTYQVPEPAIGDMVLVKEDGLPPAQWLFGIVEQKHPGLDGVTRVVSLRCKNAVLKRPVVKLCILPINTVQ